MTGRQHIRSAADAPQVGRAERTGPAREPGASALGNQTLQRLVRDGGAGLPPGPRRQAEGRLGVGLEDIRVHRGPEAARVARGLGVRAAAEGPTIVLGAEADEVSLGHELVHVAQRKRAPGGAVRRSRSRAGDASEREALRLSREVLTDGPPLSVREAPAARLQAQDPQYMPESAEGPPSFDADWVNVGELTNEEMNSELIRVDDWLRLHARQGEPETTAMWGLAGRLRDERTARVRAGHVWLEKAGRTLPTRLVGLARGAARIEIIEVDLVKAFGKPEGPSPDMILTEEQYERYLSARGIVVTDMEGYQTLVAAGQLPAPEGEGLSTQPPAEPVLPFGASGEESFLEAPEALSPVPMRAVQSAATGIAVSRGYVSPLDYHLAAPFAERLSGSSGGELQTWRGGMAEGAYRSRPEAGLGLLTDPLNDLDWVERDVRRRGGPLRNIQHRASEHNYPIFDYKRDAATRGVRILGVRRISVKTSLQNEAGRRAYYMSGLVAMFDVTEDLSLQHFIRNQPGQADTRRTAPGSTTIAPEYAEQRLQVLREAFIAVNSDDVASMRQALRDAPANWDAADFRRSYTGEMRENPVTVQTTGGSATIDSPEALDAARPTLLPGEYEKAQRQAGERVARRVVSSGITTEQLQALRTSRQAVPGTMSSQELGNWVSPEFIGAERRGGGVRGNALAAGRSGLQGGAGGGLIAVITTAGVMMIDEAEHPDWEQELALSGGLGGLGGFGASALEQTLISRGTSYGIARGGQTFFTPGSLRYGAGGVAAALTAPVMENISMSFLEPYEISGEERAVRSARAAGIGVASFGAGAAATAATTSLVAVMFGTAATGAAAGTVVPGWGTALGFVVGLGVGAYAYYKLDQALPGGREDWHPSEPPVPVLRPALSAPLGRLSADLQARLRLTDPRERGAQYAGAISDEALPEGFGLGPEGRGGP